MAAWKCLLSESDDESSMVSSPSTLPVSKLDKMPVSRAVALNDAQKGNGLNIAGVEDKMLKTLVSEKADGPSGWIERLRESFADIFASLGKQKRKLVIGSGCSGSGCPTLALAVPISVMHQPVNCSGRLSTNTDTVKPSCLRLSATSCLQQVNTEQMQRRNDHASVTAFHRE